MKNFSKQQWLVLLLLGLLLVVIAIPTEEKAQDVDASSGFGLPETESREVISSDLELQLESLLNQMEGVGQVQVMLYMEERGSSFSSIEKDPAGAGDIRGALIVAEGADNPVTIRNIQEAVMALFQVEAHKIKVVKMK